MKVEVTAKLTIVNARAPLRALADVTLHWDDGEIIIRRCAVFARSGEPPWAALPRLPIQRKGKREYAAFIDLPRDLRRRVLEQILTE
jgi:hypothetical protein